ncbi:uncharacterized protein LOC111698387 [Eurytemora carolleeae]|uniref:uncharacterized protein LOC111698387 n=1 Tax=Eurytemora carolleeae TaxID=1294199 RepID=UPI000C76E87A|nr:uncharacterized protein LOC111698387 [Eurytemora carolleeae]|eukprot:XP_023324477.1 uncharacterized protein LOC111698387 [Eurytemora affinis]
MVGTGIQMRIFVVFSLLQGLMANRFVNRDMVGASHDVICPISQAKPNFNIDLFMGHWYILEYQYPREMKLTDLSCLSFDFNAAGEDIVGNFSFRYPPRFGHYYHIPTVSNVIANGQEGLWMTSFKGVSLLSGIVDTDYENWAVFVQCVNESGENKFMSTRVLSRTRDLSPQDWLTVREAIQV